MGDTRILLGLLLICVTVTNASWGTPGSGQYHIQTDEGPERYFRYQTDSGQFRKEKRLQDGTVIGTDAWIDALGYLRQKDYIADNQGYRILKSKTVYVGRDQSIQDAMKAAKKTPASAGVLVGTDQPKKIFTPIYSTTTTTTVAPLPPLRSNSVGYDYPSPPTVYIRPHSEPIDPGYLPPKSNTIHLPERPTYTAPSSEYLPSNTYRPSTEYRSLSTTLAPPYSDSELITTPIAVYPSSTTPRPYTDDIDYGTPLATYSPSSTSRPYTNNIDYGSPIAAYSTTTARPDFHSVVSSTPKSLEYGSPFSLSTSSSPVLPTVAPTAIAQLNNELVPPKLYSEPSAYSHYIPPIESTTARPSTSKPIGPLINNNVDNIQPLFNRNLLTENDYARRPSYQYYYPNIGRNNNNNQWERSQNQIGNGYDPQYSLYDGVSVTNNGFRYYLPRQYHEEENSGSDTRTGSFGYIDPFGIRRVIYYNTGPGQGFNHRKNNRYVGFNATPYDPRPL